VVDVRAYTAVTALAPLALLHGLMHDRVNNSSLPSLRDALRVSTSGNCVACAIPLVGPPATRLWSLALLRLRRWTATRVLTGGGADVVACWGVHPHLESPSCVFDLHSSAATYAGDHLQPRGSKVALRRILKFVFGCDPALGAIVIVGRKR
jgi:hypothetical protein